MATWFKVMDDGGVRLDICREIRKYNNCDSCPFYDHKLITCNISGTPIEKVIKIANIKYGLVFKKGE